MEAGSSCESMSATTGVEFRGFSKGHFADMVQL